MGATRSEQPWTMQGIPLEMKSLDGGGSGGSCGSGCGGCGCGGKDADECGERVVTIPEVEANDCDDEDDICVNAAFDGALELEQQPCFIGRQLEHGRSFFTHAQDLQRAWIPLQEQHFFCRTEPDADGFTEIGTDAPSAIIMGT